MAEYLTCDDLMPGDVIFVRKGWYTVKHIQTVEDKRGFTCKVTFCANTQNDTPEWSQRFNPDNPGFLRGGK